MSDVQKNGTVYLSSFWQYKVHQHICNGSPLTQVMKQSDPRHRNTVGTYSQKPGLFTAQQRCYIQHLWQVINVWFW